MYFYPLLGNTVTLYAFPFVSKAFCVNQYSECNAMSNNENNDNL